MSKSKEFKEKNTIEDSVIAGYAAQETMKLPGVIRMAPGIAESFSRNILGRITETQGVHVNDEDGKVTVDIHIIAAYGVNIPQLSYDIQNRVKKSSRRRREFPSKQLISVLRELKRAGNEYYEKRRN